jgi:hypothetical protein
MANAEMPGVELFPSKNRFKPLKPVQPGWPEEVKLVAMARLQRNVNAGLGVGWPIQQQRCIHVQRQPKVVIGIPAKRIPLPTRRRDLCRCCLSKTESLRSA